MKQVTNTLIIDQEIKDKENAKKLDILNGKIEFKNISFGYDN
jgi:ABC-type transport system involved in Fe-S cluster assembly fused permease/ATPase subunit